MAARNLSLERVNGGGNILSLVLFNRQPSLHKLSIMCHRVRSLYHRLRVYAVLTNTNDLSCPSSGQGSALEDTAIQRMCLQPLQVSTSCCLPAELTSIDTRSLFLSSADFDGDEMNLRASSVAFARFRD